MKKKFTQEGVDRLRPPPTGRVEYGDAYVSGLMLRVTAAGVKSWSVLYKVKGEGGISDATGIPLKGTQRRITLGKFPVMGVKQARDAAIDVLQKADNGNDIRIEKKEDLTTRITNTFEAVARKFIEQEAKPNVSSWSRIERALDLHVFPTWSNRPIADIRRSDVHELLDRFVSEGALGTAQEVRSNLSRVFNWAIEREIITDSPMVGLKRKDLHSREDAGRALTDDELKAIWHAAKQLNYPFGPYFQIMMLTGQRRNEWANARLSEVCDKRKILEVPKTRYKGRRDHIVPMVPEVWKIFEAMPRWYGSDPYLFSTQAGTAPISGFSKAKTQLDALAVEEMKQITGKDNATLANYRIHDFRVTCESRLADLGFNQDVRDAVLGHAKVGLQRTYNKHDYADEKREALAAFAKHVMSVVD